MSYVATIILDKYYYVVGGKAESRAMTVFTCELYARKFANIYTEMLLNKHYRTFFSP